MHICNEKGCEIPVFGGGKCKYHQFKRHMRGGDLYKPKKKPQEARSPSHKGKPPQESKRRKKEHIYYTLHCKELEQEIREQNNGKIYCFFSGVEIKDKVVWHHLRGRTGNFYTDKTWLVPCINEYHLDYHFKPIGWLMQQPWYGGFLTRLKDKSIELWEKERKKQDKAQLSLNYHEEEDEE